MTSANKILIAGCSFATGSGMPDGRNNPGIWSTQLVNNMWPGSCITNIAEDGHSNESIFLSVLDEITKNSYDYVIVEWSETRRINYNIGLELYDTKSRLVPAHDYNLVNDTTVKGSWLFKNIQMPLDEVLNDHWDILKLVKYVNTLRWIQQTKGKIFFVNGLGCWPRDYFTKQKSWQDSDDYTKKTILQMDYRDDSQIEQLYNKIHSAYSNAGGIQEELWLNLYDSMSWSKIDTISKSDDHPGPLSHNKFGLEFTAKTAEILSKYKTNSIGIA